MIVVDGGWRTVVNWTPDQRAALGRILARAEQRTLRDEVEEDITDERTLTREQQDARMQRVVAGHFRLLRDAGMPEREPPAPDFHDIWSRLVAFRRRTRG
jgi:hypothetical protein